MFQHRIDTLNLELTNHCNFDCDFCANHFITRPKGFMDVGLAKRLITEAAENKFCSRIVLHVMGEPFLHENLFEVIDHAQKQKQKIVVVTNGSLLSAENARRILHHAPDFLVISFHVGDEASFRHRKAHISYEKYKEMVFDFIEFKYEMKSHLPLEIECLSTLYMKSDRFQILDSLHEFQTFEKEWLELSRRLKKKYALRMKPPYVLLPGVNPLLEGLTLSLKLNYFYWAGAIHPIDTTLVPATKYQCEAPVLQCNVLWNGDLVPCCYDYDGELAYASVNHQSLIEAFLSEAGEQYRNQFRKGGVIPLKCRKCLGALKNPDGTDYHPLRNDTGPLDLGGVRIALGLLRKRFVLFHLRTALKAFWGKISVNK